MAEDPTYPLFPVFGLLSAVLLLILLTTNIIRRSWNLGVTSLCFWLFWDNLSRAINAIIWADNADLKFYVYCDIVSHLYMFTSIVKPAYTLILTRRLYKIASMRSLLPDSRRAKAMDIFIEWSLGLGLPVVVTGVFYYIVQGTRFKVNGGLGCENNPNSSGVEILLIESPGVILPLISAFFYCPKIIYVFYRHGQSANQFLQTNGSVTKSTYSRILALGCLDIFLTLPFGILRVICMTHNFLPGFSMHWYSGWSFTHSDWGPVSFSWNDTRQLGTWAVFNAYFPRWSSVILALAVFALFGFTAERRAAYRCWIYAILKPAGWTAPMQKHHTITQMQFAIGTIETGRQTQMSQSASVAFPGLREESSDAKHGFHASISWGSGEDKLRSAIFQSGSPNVELAATECHGNSIDFSRSDDSSDCECSGADIRDVKCEHSSLEAPTSAGLFEETGPVKLTHSSPTIEGTQTS